MTALRRLCALLSAAALVAGAGLAPASRADDAAPTAAEVRSQRILELEGQVRDAQERLADLISEPVSENAPLRERPELAEIAAELSTLNVELRALRAEVAQATAAPPAP